MLKSCIKILFLFHLITAIKGVTNVKNVIGCEHNEIELKCDDGKSIDILDANYGRTTEVTCMQNKVQNVTCYSDNSVSILTDLCEGKQHCKIQSSNNVFGDPCPGTVKYLFVLYKCVALADFKIAVSCEHEAAQLKCDAGKVIRVLEANYGRKSRLTCYDKDVKVTNCENERSYGIVSEKCDNKHRCHIRASNDIFGDPCIGTYKYLSVKYKCTKAPECTSAKEENIPDGFLCNDGSTIPDSLVCNGRRDCSDGDDEFSCDYETRSACEGNRLKIYCDKDETIRIVNGLYGRMSSNICPGARNYNTECYSSTALTFFRQRCEKKNSCDFEASNRNFGDPCPNTYKYAEVQYICEKDPNSKHAINPRSV